MGRTEKVIFAKPGERKHIHSQQKETNTQREKEKREEQPKQSKEFLISIQQVQIQQTAFYLSALYKYQLIGVGSAILLFILCPDDMFESAIT